MQGLALAALLLLFASSALAFTPVDDLHGDPHLPRPLIVELPEVQSSVDAGSEDLRLWCGSWRLAGEANNLGPWKTVPKECGEYVRNYMVGKAYLFDLERVVREAVAYANSIDRGADGMDVWVFDIDETLLSNLPYYAQHCYGLEIFDHLLFDKWVEEAVAPSIQSSLRLYEEVLGLGFKIFLLTGRSEAHRSITVENLLKAGFHDWEKLILREVRDKTKSATAYKSEKREELVQEGYRLLANLGDQWSDLLGSSTATRSFKFPNPMYYIP